MELLRANEGTLGSLFGHMIDVNEERSRKVLTRVTGRNRITAGDKGMQR